MSVTRRFGVESETRGDSCPLAGSFTPAQPHASGAQPPLVGVWPRRVTDHGAPALSPGMTTASGHLGDRRVFLLAGSGSDPRLGGDALVRAPVG